MRTLCADMGDDIDVRLELGATPAKGILDRQGMAKVRHIDVNVLCLQEQCARKLVPPHQILGEKSWAGLTTKHLANPSRSTYSRSTSSSAREGQ